MNTRDLGTHVVELHDQGTLDIIGSGVRLTLPARETLELLHWLYEHKDILDQATFEDQDTEELVAELRAEASTDRLNQEEVDVPVDEP